MTAGTRVPGVGFDVTNLVYAHSTIGACFFLVVGGVLKVVFYQSVQGLAVGCRVDQRVNGLISVHESYLSVCSMCNVALLSGLVYVHVMTKWFVK